MYYLPWNWDFYSSPYWDLAYGIRNGVAYYYYYFVNPMHDEYPIYYKYGT